MSYFDTYACSRQRLIPPPANPSRPCHEPLGRRPATVFAFKVRCLTLYQPHPMALQFVAPHALAVVALRESIARQGGALLCSISTPFQARCLLLHDRHTL